MKRNTVKMSMGGPTGGGGVTKDNVIALIWGAKMSGVNTDDGCGLRYLEMSTNTEVT
jgi:hypothetical protein